MLIIRVKRGDCVDVNDAGVSVGVNGCWRMWVLTVADYVGVSVLIIANYVMLVQFFFFTEYVNLCIS